MRLEKPGAVQHVGAQLALVETGLQRAAVVVIAGIAADREQAVRRQREKSLDCAAARHVLDVGVEAAVLVDHQDGGEGAVPGRLHEIAAHRARIAARRRIGDVGRLEAGVGEGNRLGLGVARHQGLRHCQAAHRHGGGLLQERATIDAPMAVFVVERVDALVDPILCDVQIASFPLHSHRHSSLPYAVRK